MTYLREDIAGLWRDSDPVEAAFALQGETYRDVPGRRTMRVLLGDKAYFVKLHYGVGWGEIVKNLVTLKLPVIGARNEFEACRDLHAVGVKAPVPAAFAQDAGSVASRRSFVLCDELAGFVSLEDVTDAWFDQSASPQFRHRLMYRVADFARTFHGHGFIHRDFYICHILIHPDDLATELNQADAQLAVLDLHRARRFDAIPVRWLKRDLAALLYSSLDLGYSRRDWLRFIARYTGRPLREELARNGAFWRAVFARAEKLYTAGLRKGLVKGVYRS